MKKIFAIRPITATLHQKSRLAVEPAFRLSGVRTGCVEQQAPRIVATIFEEWCRKEDYSALRASPFGSPGKPAIKLAAPICRTSFLSVRGSNRKRYTGRTDQRPQTIIQMVPQ